MEAIHIFNGTLDYWTGTPNDTFDIYKNDQYVYEDATEIIGSVETVDGRSIRNLDPLLIKVRPAVCLIGLDWFLVQNVKKQIIHLVPDQVVLESFCVRKPSDVKDGSLLVPKIILVVDHMPGKKLVDEEADEGQVDFIYDEIVDSGADLLIIYTNLPVCIYPAIKHMVYHPKMIDLVFPQQRLLRDLANDNALVTTVQGSQLNHMQKNLIKEWIQTPVYSSHPVYQSARKLFDQYFPFWIEEESDFWSESEISRRKDDSYSLGTQEYCSATESHPLAAKKSKRKLYKIREKLRRKTKYSALKETEESNLELSSYGKEEFVVGEYDQIAL